MKLVNNLDFSKYEARNMRLQNLATAPASPVEGQEYYDTTLKVARVWNGTAWVNSGAGGSVTSVTGAAPIVSSGGTTPQISITAATPSAAGAMSSADKTKLDGVAAGATANSTDAQLRDRSTHTGSQAISTVTGLQTALDNKLDDSQLGAASGVASLGADGKVPSSQLPAIAFTNVYVVASIVERDALTGLAEGDVAIVNGDRSYIWTGTVWEELDSATDGIQSLSVGTGITSTGGNNPTISVDTAVVVRKVAANIGDGAATSFVITHNLNTRDVAVQVYNNASPYDVVLADVELTSTTTCTVRFAAAPALNAYRVVIHG